MGLSSGGKGNWSNGWDASSCQGNSCSYPALPCSINNPSTKIFLQYLELIWEWAPTGKIFVLYVTDLISNNVIGIHLRWGQIKKGIVTQAFCPMHSCKLYRKLSDILLQHPTGQTMRARYSYYSSSMQTPGWKQMSSKVNTDEKAIQSLSSCLCTELKCLSGIKWDLGRSGRVKVQQVGELTKCAAVSASPLGFCFLLQTLQNYYEKHSGIPLGQWLAWKATIKNPPQTNPFRTCMTDTCDLV